MLNGNSPPIADYSIRLKHRIMLIAINIFFKRMDKFVFMIMALGFDEGFCIKALGYSFKLNEFNAKIVVAKILGSPYVTDKLADLNLKY